MEARVAGLLVANEIHRHVAKIPDRSLASVLGVIDEIFGEGGVLGSDVTQHPVAQG